VLSVEWSCGAWNASFRIFEVVKEVEGFVGTKFARLGWRREISVNGVKASGSSEIAEEVRGELGGAEQLGKDPRLRAPRVD
jgi:hypothetical protein